MALPPQTPRPTGDVDTQQRFDKREKSIDRWLAAVGIGMTAAAAFLTAITVAAVVLGFFSFQRFRQIETEARQHMVDARRYAEEAKRLVEDITAAHDEAQVRLAELNAETVITNPTEAARTVENIQADPTASPIDRAVAAAVWLQQQGNFEEAIEKWRSIANIAGEEDRQLQARAWFSVGYLRHEGGKYEAALADFDRAIELNPADAAVYVARGDIKRHLGQYEAAFADFDRAIELNPDEATAYHNRGQVKHDLGQYEAALAEFDRAIELNPATGAAASYSSRGDIKRHLGLYEAAFTDFDRAIELNPALDSAYHNRGNAKDDLGQYEAALVDFDQAIELAPSDALAYYNRGGTKDTLGRINEAREDYQKALDLAQEAGDEDIVRRAKGRLNRLDNNEAS